MDVIVILLVLATIVVLAPKFGSDSRDLTDSYPNRDRIRPL